MPIYEFVCPNCKNKFEEWLKIEEAENLQACPKCQSLSSRIISNTSFILKGDGWYVTEYGNKKGHEDTTTSSVHTSNSQSQEVQQPEDRAANVSSAANDN